ncbi:hypothetical protein GCM10020367_43110 [Streptomyces sannanensis]|uniref:Uncharacterized protein n=1 Tax=Streptomyces sannanensis TaxID=285536 RepID=A0ABP6SFE1_9ACTN
MASARARQRLTGPPQGGFVCPACGQAVETTVHRHKTLGTYVPIWAPGPCRNPKCSEYTGELPEEPATGAGTEEAGGDDAPAADRSESSG